MHPFSITSLKNKLLKGTMSWSFYKKLTFSNNHMITKLFFTRLKNLDSGPIGKLQDPWEKRAVPSSFLSKLIT